MANKKFRVLVAGLIGSLAVRPNDVVLLPDALAKAHGDALDGNKEAVAYALSQNGNAVIEYKGPSEVENSALLGVIADLEASLDAAADADRPALEAQLAEKRHALAALQG